MIVSINGGAVMMSPAGGPPAGAQVPPRYRMTIAASIQNLTNRPNYGGYSGVMTSPFFGRSTYAGSPRRIDVTMSFNF